MKEVAGAVIATSLVLVAVFVPVALFPGTTGILFRQFALTIAFSVSISAFNALTLTPALSAIFLGHHRERAQGAFFRAFNRGVDWVTEMYRSLVRHVIGWRFAALLLFVGVLGATYWVYQSVPRAFIPEDDQGFIMFIIQAPQGASLTYTRDLCAKVEQVLASEKDISAAFTVAGFSQAGNAPNRAIIYANLQPFDQRKGDAHSAQAIINKLRGPLFMIPGGLVVPFNPPAVQGLGQFGGFSFQLEDLGRNSLQTIANTANTLTAQGNATGKLAGLFTSFTANDPQYLVRIDREKAKSLQVPFSQITDALQVYMGSVYVNDFDFNNRSYRVYLQADEGFRAQAKDIRQYYLRSDTGKMIPLDNVASIEQTANPQVISHYNLFRSGRNRRQRRRWTASPGPGDRRHGSAGAKSFAERHDVRMERIVAGRIRVGRQGVAAVWIGLGRRVSDAGGAVRELRTAVHCVAGRAGSVVGRDRVAGAARIAERCVLPDRAGHVDRSVEQKRDFDRGVRGAVARAGFVDCGSGD